MENKTQGNENKIMLVDFNSTMDKMNRGVGNKTQKLYRYRSKFALSKLIVDNGLEDLWRRENPDTSEFTCYDRSSGTRSRIDRVYTDIKSANNTKINHKIITFTYHYNVIMEQLLTDPLPKKKNGKALCHFHNSLLYKSEFCSATKKFLSFLKPKKNNCSSSSGWWEYIKCGFKENARTFSKVLQLKKILKFLG